MRDLPDFLNDDNEDDLHADSSSCLSGVPSDFEEEYNIEFDAQPEVLPEAERLAIALQKLENKELSYREANQTYGFSIKLLWNRVHDKRSRGEFYTARQKLNPEEENGLIQQAEFFSAYGFPLTITDINGFANVLLQKRYIAAGNEGTPPTVGIHWYKGFLNRHPEFRARYLRTLGYQRYTQQTPENIAHFIDILRGAIAEYGVDIRDIWNMDEKGYAQGIENKAKYVVRAVDLTLKFKVSSENREWATTIEAVNTTGQSIPPFIILKGKRVLASWVETLNKLRLSKWYLAVSEKGWTDDKLAEQWLEEVFIPASAKLAHGQKRILVLDGHGSHLTPEFAVKAWDQNVVCVVLPPHTSHLLQPLDVGVFGAMDGSYRKALREKSKYGVVHIDKHEFLRIYDSIRSSQLNTCNILNGWRLSGLNPLDKDIVISKLPKPDLVQPIYDPNNPPASPQTVSVTNHPLCTPKRTEDVSKYLRYLRKATPRAADKITKKLEKRDKQNTVENNLNKKAVKKLFVDNQSKGLAKRSKKSLGPIPGRVIDKEACTQMLAMKARKEREKAEKALVALKRKEDKATKKEEEEKIRQIKQAKRGLLIRVNKALKSRWEAYGISKKDQKAEEVVAYLSMEHFDDAEVIVAQLPPPTITQPLPTILQGRKRHADELEVEEIAGRYGKHARVEE